MNINLSSRYCHRIMFELQSVYGEGKQFVARG